MFDHRHAHCQKSAASRVWLSALMCVALLLAQGMPTRGVAMQDSELIEICSEFGVAFVRMDADGNVPERGKEPCPDCDDCTLCALSGVFAPNECVGADVPALIVDRANARSAQIDTPNPAQFWAANRGPPSQFKIEMNMPVTCVMAPPTDERAMS